MVGALTFQLPSPARAQANTTPQNEIVFHTFKREADWPVYIDHLEIDGKFIPMDTPVRVNPGWLKKLVVVVENTSPKTVVEGGVKLDFPETGSGTVENPRLATASNLGQYPPYTKYRSDGTIQKVPQRPAIKVLPGGTMNLPFSDVTNDAVMAEAQRVAGHITRVNVTLQFFFFEDSSERAMGGYFWVPDKQPGKLMRISAQEFYSVPAK